MSKQPAGTKPGARDHMNKGTKDGRKIPNTRDQKAASNTHPPRASSGFAWRFKRESELVSISHAQHNKAKQENKNKKQTQTISKTQTDQTKNKNIRERKHKKTNEK
eukprot:gnl/MRDRNA2_/MRDRNA2_26545_c0_seq2.p2 gnl/MRDRNA2_/MRDRNA2_26545_c0~~gnl/MRDRNA2_/MRDRNA2_26545_c0_seq2.p2  ORF type:complete len:106 (+),score=16.77 gnl/MRDRNA2_/MRDRNA2_26545_c0_seq2:76-393(+)